MTKKVFRKKPFKVTRRKPDSFYYSLLGLVGIALLTLIIIIAGNQRKDPTPSNSGINPTIQYENESEKESDNKEQEDPKPESEQTPSRITMPSNAAGPYRVTNIVDGDTIDVDVDGETVRVRLIGVNTPETKHPSKPQECFGAEASSYLHNLLYGKVVYLELDGTQDKYDRYRRLLVYLYLDGKNVNYTLISGGYAYEYTYNTSYKYQTEFIEAQSEASENNRGLWSPLTCNGKK